MKITEGKASIDSGKGKEIVEDSEPEEEHPLSPMFRTQMELPVKELPPFVWRREDVTTFIWHCSGSLLDRQQVGSHLLGGCAAPLARWTLRGFSVRQPIDHGPSPSRSLWQCESGRGQPTG